MNESNTKITDVFDERASILGSKIAVRENEKDWSYTELLGRSEELSNYLLSMGVSDGDRVGLMLPNSGAFVTSFFGIARVGGIIAPLNAKYRMQELMFYINDISPSAIVVGSEAVKITKDTLAQIEQSPILIEMKQDGKFQTIQKGENIDVSTTLNDDLPLLHQYTSGSTGNPKRVIRTHKQLLYELERLTRVFDLGENDRFLGAAPFSHVNGLVRTMMASMFVGGTLYPFDVFKRREVLKLITQEKITYFGAVPYMFVILGATSLSGDVDLSSIRVAFSSSAPLLSDDNHRFKEKYGYFVKQLYGSTETGTISVNTDSNIEESLESVGLPLEGMVIKIIDDKGNPCSVGQEGEVIISSPSAIKAYDNNPEANDKSFKDGYYLSGDLGFLDNRGRLTLTGRKKFLINRGGYEVNPLEVEKAIQSHPKVQEVVVLGVPSIHGDQKIKCVIVSKTPCTVEEIFEHCKDKVADYKIPSVIDFTDSLPKSQTGKILRNKL